MNAWEDHKTMEKFLEVYAGESAILLPIEYATQLLQAGFLALIEYFHIYGFEMKDLSQVTTFNLCLGYLWIGHFMPASTQVVCLVTYCFPLAPGQVHLLLTIKITSLNLFWDPNLFQSFH